MFHLSEAFQARKSDIAQQPAPSEIGGYALATDRQFASVFANAGGMMIQANTRGDTAPTNGNFWTPLGLVRFARVGWDTRLWNAGTGDSFPSQPVLESPEGYSPAIPGDMVFNIRHVHDL